MLQEYGGEQVYQSPGAQHGGGQDQGHHRGGGQLHRRVPAIGGCRRSWRNKPSWRHREGGEQ